MDPTIGRVMLALGLAALLFWQSRRVASRRNQRRAYALAALALLVIAGLNASLLIGGPTGTPQLVAGALAFLLLLGTAFFLLQGYRSGEMRADVERTNQMAREFHERRERELRERDEPPGAGGP